MRVTGTEGRPSLCVAVFRSITTAVRQTNLSPDGRQLEQFDDQRHRPWEVAFAGLPPLHGAEIGDADQTCERRDGQTLPVV